MDKGQKIKSAREHEMAGTGEEELRGMGNRVSHRLPILPRVACCANENETRPQIGMLGRVRLLRLFPIRSAEASLWNAALRLDRVEIVILERLLVFGAPQELGHRVLNADHLSADGARRQDVYNLQETKKERERDRERGGCGISTTYAGHQLEHGVLRILE